MKHATFPTGRQQTVAARPPAGRPGLPGGAAAAQPQAADAAVSSALDSPPSAPDPPLPATPDPPPPAAPSKADTFNATFGSPEERKAYFAERQRQGRKRAKRSKAASEGWAKRKKRKTKAASEGSTNRTQ